ncbi:putative quinol monooxygenase [Paenibacillus methanolicus]|uniref:Quinol monooxygenase YgiN n=1 Tax=Paenibacillus methanolicus TaxID=582686 RepID=A0A5S5CGX5_9BACL|nr:antibiotic biosynthesis monooxygenase family protein [Paenibacillus methanolicus]TYP79010.1 quinol monooxygenase YgiN [Paenibacillus methanolicus]
MQKFSMVAKFIAKTGEGEKLARILLDAGDSLQAVPACEAYIVYLSDTEADTIWVTEIWADAQSHEASLAQPETRAAIAQAMPLIEGVEGTKLRPLGGKGLT